MRASIHAITGVPIQAQTLQGHETRARLLLSHILLLSDSFFLQNSQGYFMRLFFKSGGAVLQNKKRY